MTNGHEVGDFPGVYETPVYHSSIPYIIIFDIIILFITIQVKVESNLLAPMKMRKKLSSKFQFEYEHSDADHL